jgi:amino acid transporter
MVGTVVMFNSAALTLSFDRTTLAVTSASSDPVTPVIVNSFGAWAEKPFLAIVMVSFLACGASVVNYVSRIIYSMAREGNMPVLLKQVAVDGTPRPAILFTVLSAGVGLLLGLNDQAVATIIAFGTGGLYAMFTMTTGVGLYTRFFHPSKGNVRPIEQDVSYWIRESYRLRYGREQCE